jgi:hypothetical protein
MKTICMASKTGRLPSLIVAVIFVLFTFSCEEADYTIKSQVPDFDPQESNEAASWQDTTFVVDPSGTHIIALDGKVELRIFEGADLLPTGFSISSFSTVGWDSLGLNLQKWGMILESSSEERTFYNKVRIWMTYDLFQRTVATLKEENLTIYGLVPNIISSTGFESIGNCFKDFTYQKIRGYIKGCGYYVVGEK